MKLFSKFFKLNLVGFSGLVLGLSVGLLALSSCAQQCIQMPYGTTETSMKVKATNGDLIITSPGSTLSSGNLLRGKAVIVNNTDKALSAKYQFQWRDMEGLPAPTNTPWQPVVISPHSSQVISDVAPTPQMNSYIVQVCR